MYFLTLCKERTDFFKTIISLLLQKLSYSQGKFIHDLPYLSHSTYQATQTAHTCTNSIASICFQDKQLFLHAAGELNICGEVQHINPVEYSKTRTDNCCVLRKQTIKFLLQNTINSLFVQFSYVTITISISKIKLKMNNY